MAHPEKPWAEWLEEYAETEQREIVMHNETGEIADMEDDDAR